MLFGRLHMQAAKMKQIYCRDWFPAPTIWSHLQQTAKDCPLPVHKQTNKQTNKCIHANDKETKRTTNQSWLSAISSLPSRRLSNIRRAVLGKAGGARRSLSLRASSLRFPRYLTVRALCDSSTCYAGYPIYKTRGRYYTSLIGQKPWNNLSVYHNGSKWNLSLFL